LNKAIIVAFGMFVLCGCSRQDALFTAIRAGDLPRVRSICKQYPSVVRAEDEYGSIGLNIAVECGRPEIVRAMIDAGSDLHHASPTKGMPLNDAAYFGKKEILDMLLQAGADVNRQPDPPTLSDNGSALEAAVLGCKLEIVEILLCHGADVNLPSNDSRHVLPLDRAAALDPTNADAVKIVELLLTHGANVNASDELGVTALSIARHHSEVSNGHTAIIDTLLRHGATERGGVGKSHKR
jgi:uncharacterized protein